MESAGDRTDDRSDEPASQPAPIVSSEAVMRSERISITGLDQQSAEALQMAVTRLARRYGVEVRTEVSAEPPRPQE